MLKTGKPERLWHDCIEFMANIWSNTSNDHADLKIQKPETIVSGETDDIPESAEFGWFDWIVFRDTTVSYPGRKPQLGRYCGPAYDIGPTMTAKILKKKQIRLRINTQGTDRWGKVWPSPQAPARRVWPTRCWEAWQKSEAWGFH